MKPVNILIVENEFIIAEKLSTDLASAGYMVTGVATSGEEAVAMVAKYLPDLIIMDIKLEGEIDGIDAATMINKNYSIPVIYLTGYTDQNLFARAKFTRPASYLTKPYNPSDVYHAIELALYSAAANDKGFDEKKTEKEGPLFVLSNKIFVKDSKNCFLRVCVDDIFWIEAEGSYSNIETAEGKYITSHNLKAIEKKIHHKNLLRVHRSFIINLDKIKHIVGKSTVVMENPKLCLPRKGNNENMSVNCSIPIGREYRDGLHKHLNMI
jgi:DNA-binding LytR/AlgR family response regulator